MRQTTLVRLGALTWLLQLQYFIVQLFTGLAWQPPAFYSLRTNTISDLGNTVCGQYGGQLVCSPLHGLMNLSFVLLGLTIIIGAVALGSTERRSLARLGYACMVAAGIGTILVGCFPENTVAQLHVVGAALPFILGNIGLILMGISARAVPATLRRLGIWFGIIALIGLCLYFTHHYLGLGNGGMERVVAYPQTIWMILTGAALLRAKPRAKSS